MVAPSTTPTRVPLLLKILPLMTDLPETPDPSCACCNQIARQFRRHAGHFVNIQTTIAIASGGNLARDALIRREKLCDLRQFKETCYIAIDAAEFASSRFHEHKSHRPAAFRADRRRGILGHRISHSPNAGVQHCQSSTTAESAKRW